MKPTSKIPAVPAVTRIVQAVNGLQISTNESIQELAKKISSIKSEMNNTSGISSEDFDNIITAINCMADRITDLEDRCRAENNKVMERLGSITDRIAVQLAEATIQPCGFCPNEAEDCCMPELGESEEPVVDVEDNIIGEPVCINEFGMIESNHYDSDGKKHGECIIRSRPGDDEFASITCTYLNGVLHGRYTEIEGNDRVVTTGGYWNGKAEGKWVTTTSDPSCTVKDIRETYYMREGKLDGLYFITQGSIEIENGQYRDGKKHGEWKTWDFVRQEYAVVHYANGLRNGDCYINGQKQYYMAGKLITDYYCH